MTAADELRPLLFGNVPVEAWPSDDDATAEPWASFVRARRHLASGDADLAIREWAPIATFDLWEPRHRLQAWTFLRSAGIQPFWTIGREQPYSAPRALARFFTNCMFSTAPRPRPPATTMSA